MKNYCETCKNLPICCYSGLGNSIFKDEKIQLFSDDISEMTKGTPLKAGVFCEEYEKGEVDALISFNEETYEILKKRDWQE